MNANTVQLLIALIPVIIELIRVAGPEVAALIDKLHKADPDDMKQIMAKLESLNISELV